MQHKRIVEVKAPYPGNPLALIGATIAIQVAAISGKQVLCTDEDRANGMVFAKDHAHKPFASARILQVGTQDDLEKPPVRHEYPTTGTIETAMTWVLYKCQVCVPAEEPRSVKVCYTHTPGLMLARIGPGEYLGADGAWHPFPRAPQLPPILPPGLSTFMVKGPLVKAAQDESQSFQAST